MQYPTDDADHDRVPIDAIRCNLDLSIHVPPTMKADSWKLLADPHQMHQPPM